MRNSIITQIALLGISIVIVVTYIQPSIQNIGAVQDETFQYADATAKANEFNALLQQLLARERSFSNADIRALEAFLPSRVDDIAVMQDINTIVNQNGGEVVEMKASEPIAPNPDIAMSDLPEAESMVTNRFSSQEFNVTFVSNYNNFVQIIRDFERTAYVLEITKLNFGTVGDSSRQLNPLNNSEVMEFSVILKAYSLPATS